MSKFGNAVKIGSTLLAAAGGVAGAVEVVDTVVESYQVNQVHEITYTDTYLINGNKVSEDTFIAWLDNQGSVDRTPLEYTFTAADFDTDGIARLSEYIDFEFDSKGCYAARIISDKVVAVEFDYAISYLGNTDGVNFTSTNSNVIYQDTTNGRYGLTFTVGAPTEEGYEINYGVSASNFGVSSLQDYYLFYFETPTGNFKPLSFYEVFNSITLTIER